jgi:uncharacterized alkaline shock family protein YloU
VRKAALGSYGVAAVRGPRWFDRPLGWLGLGTPGVRVRADDRLHVEVNLALVDGVPAAAVASNVTKAVRYVVQRDLGRTIDELVVLEGGRPLKPSLPGAPARPRPATAKRTGRTKR